MRLHAEKKGKKNTQNILISEKDTIVLEVFGKEHISRQI